MNMDTSKQSVRAVYKYFYRLLQYDRLGVDVVALPRIAAEDTYLKRKEKVQS
jgi:hypothetical protein